MNGARDEELERTIALTRVDAPMERVRTAEFVPPSGARPTGESTLPWRRERGMPRSMLRLLSIGAAHRRGLVVAAVALGLALVAIAGWLSSGTRTPRRAAVRWVEAAPPGNAAIDSAADPDGGSAGAPDAGVGLGEAVDALAEGRLERARQLYERLSADHPEDRSLTLAVEILVGAGHRGGGR